MYVEVRKDYDTERFVIEINKQVFARGEFYELPEAYERLIGKLTKYIDMAFDVQVSGDFQPGS